MTNWFSIVVGIMQIGAAGQALYQKNYSMAAVFVMYGICSVILARVK